jgi:repressor LexA
MLSPKQQQTLEAIQAYVDEHGYPPAIRELASILGVSATNVAFRIDVLVQKGYIHKQAGVARAYRIAPHFRSDTQRDL